MSEKSVLIAFSKQHLCINFSVFILIWTIGQSNDNYVLLKIYPEILSRAEYI